RTGVMGEVLGGLAHQPRQGQDGHAGSDEDQRRRGVRIPQVEADGNEQQQEPEDRGQWAELAIRVAGSAGPSRRASTRSRVASKAARSPRGTGSARGDWIFRGLTK